MASVLKSPFPLNLSPLKLLYTSFHNVPDPSASIICECASSENNGGFQAIIVRSRADTHLAFGQLPNCSSTDNVFVQTTPRGQCFVKFSESKSRVRMSLAALICIVEFFSSPEWPRVVSKMKLQMVTMREKSSLITVEPGISFVNSGHCRYEAYFENGYAVKAKADSKDASDRIYVWIETPSDRLDLDPEPVVQLGKSLTTLRSILKDEIPAKRPRQS